MEGGGGESAPAGPTPISACWVLPTSIHLANIIHFMECLCTCNCIQIAPPCSYGLCRLLILIIWSDSTQRVVSAFEQLLLNCWQSGAELSHTATLWEAATVLFSIHRFIMHYRNDSFLRNMWKSTIPMRDATLPKCLLMKQSCKSHRWSPGPFGTYVSRMRSNYVCLIWLQQNRGKKNGIFPENPIPESNIDNSISSTWRLQVNLLMYSISWHFLPYKYLLIYFYFCAPENWIGIM